MRSFQNKLVKMLLVAGVFVLNACSNGSNFVGELDEPGSPSSGAVVSGAAVKGVLADADCVATDTAGTVLYSSVGNTSACTDTNGLYSFQLSVNPTTPVLIEILARAETTMLCDFPSGCGGGIAFGSPLDIAEDFSLRAVVPSIASAATTQEVNISPWTEVAVSRAIASAGTLADVTPTITTEAYGEVAVVLNNVLSLEGTDDAFDGDFFSIDLVNLDDPGAATIDAGEEEAATLLSLASSSLFSLIDATVAPTIETVITNLAGAFEDDGEFNVNDTAANIASDNGIDLGDLVAGIATVADELEAVLDPADVTELTTFLGETTLATALETIETAAETLAAEKEAVADNDLDTTAPVEPPDETLTAAEKGLSLAIQLDNSLTALEAMLDTTQGTNSIVEDIDDVMRTASEDVEEILANLGDIAIAAADLLQDEAEDDSLATALGCTVGSTTTTCTTAQVAATLPDDSPLVGNTTGTFVITKSANLMTVADLVVDGNTYGLTMVGDGVNPDTATSLTYQITSATVDVDGDDASDVSIANTSTFSAAVTSSTETNTLNLDGLMMDIPNSFMLDVDALLVNQLVLDSADLEDALITTMDVEGSFTNNRTNDSFTGSSGQTFAFDLNLVIDESILDGTNLPEVGEDGGETSTNFFRVTTGEVSLEAPVTYSKRSTTDFASTTTASTTENLLVEVSFTRLTQAPISSYTLGLTLTSAAGTERLSGTATNGSTGAVDTLALTSPSVPDGVASLTVTNFTSDAEVTETFGGSVTVSDVEIGTIGSTGVYSQGSINFQLALTAD